MHPVIVQNGQRIPNGGRYRYPVEARRRKLTAPCWTAIGKAWQAAGRVPLRPGRWACSQVNRRAAPMLSWPPWGGGSNRGTGPGVELLRPFSVAKLLYELRYELANRPQWVQIPLDGHD